MWQAEAWPDESGEWMSEYWVVWDYWIDAGRWVGLFYVKPPPALDGVKLEDCD